MATYSRKLLHVLQIESNEVVKVIMLLSQSIFIGIFIGAFDVSAHSLFLSIFPENFLPIAFIISGFTGLCITSVYSHFQKLISFNKLIILNQIFICLVVLLLRFGFYFFSHKILVFMALIFMGPLTVMSIVGFWGVAGRLFSLRQGKRLFSLIDSGQIVGVIISSFSITILLNHNFEILNILYICSISSFFSLLIQFHINKYVSLETKDTSQPIESGKSNIIKLFRNKYVAIMAMFTIASMILAFVIHFSFPVAAKQKFPVSTDLGSFLGTFMGILMVFTLLIKTFVYSKLLKTYNLLVGLLILPIVILCFTLIAILISNIFGLSINNQSFTFLFLMIALSKLFQKSLRDSIELPSFKILYQSLHKSIRHEVQAKIDGVINEFSAMFAGVVIFILSTIEGIKLIHYSYFLFVILMVVLYLAFQLYSEYKNSLKSVLLNSQPVELYKVDRLEVLYYIEAEFVKSNNERAFFILRLMKLIQPLRYDQMLGQMLNSSYQDAKKYAIKKICADSIFEYFPEIEHNYLNYECANSYKFIVQIRSNPYFINADKIFDFLYSLVFSDVVSDKILVASYLPLAKVENINLLIGKLLQDIEPEIIIKAIKAVGKLKVVEFHQILVEYLSKPIYATTAFASLIALGDEILPALERIFYKTQQTNEVKVRLVRIYGIVGSKYAIRLLINKLGIENRRIFYQTLVSLRLCNYKASCDEIIQFKHRIKQVVGIIAWNYTAISCLKTNKAPFYLLDAFYEEQSYSIEQLFHLLSITYEITSVQQIRDSIETGTAESIGYALELLELIVDDEIKPFVFPIFEDISVSDKIKSLQEFFPLENHKFPEIIYSILNRNYNFLNRYTKLCAIKFLQTFEAFEISNSLKALFFSPDIFLSETVAVLIYKMNLNIFKSCIERVDNKHLNKIINAIDGLKDSNKHLLSEKVFFLKNTKLFKDVPGWILMELAEVIKDQEIDTDEIIFPSIYQNIPLCFIVDGNIVLEQDNNKIYFSDYEVFSHILLPHDTRKKAIIKATKPTYLYVAADEVFSEKIFNYPELVYQLLAFSKQ